MRGAWLCVFAVGAVGCGGKLSVIDDGGIAAEDAGSSSSHGPPCTQSSCASSVRVIGSVSTSEGLQMSPPGLFVGGGYVYTSTPKHLVRVPLGGGAFEVVADSALTWAIVADDTNVYWSGSGKVFELPHAGGAPVLLADTGFAATDVFVDAHDVYWQSPTGLESVSIAGGTPAAVPGGSSFGAGVLTGAGMFDAACDNLALTANGAIVAGYELVADGAHCYTLHGTSCAPYSGCGDVVSIPIGGGAPTVLAPGGQQVTVFDAQRMMVDASGVYLRRADSTTGTLIRVPLDGGSVIDITTDLALAFEVTEETIYWATVAGGVVQLKSMPKYAP